MQVVGLFDGDILTPKKIKNPGYSSNLRREGITCGACHLHVQDGVASIIGPFGDPEGLSPHPVIAGNLRLKQRCYDCHQVLDRIAKNLTCWFATGDELKNGPYGQEGKECVDCHMPKVKRPLVPGLPARTVGRHLWLGGSVPKTYAGYETLIDRGFGVLEPALDVKVTLLSEVKPGWPLPVRIDYANQRAGHYLPTGDPERHIIITVLLQDRLSTNLFRKEIRIGQIWQWGDVPKKLSDNRLKPREKRVLLLDLAMPAQLEGVRLVVEARHIRLADQMVQYMDDHLPQVAPPFREKLKAFRENYPLWTYVYHQTHWLATSKISLMDSVSLLNHSVNSQKYKKAKK